VAKLLYLVHRIPYPPNKGDKLRSYHLLRQLCARHDVYLGTFVDDPADAKHVETLRGLCKDVHAVHLDPRIARLRSLSGFAAHEALTLPYYRNASLRRWVASTVRSHGIDTAIVFSSAMAQYVSRLSSLRVLIDFVDVDSVKWTQYADAQNWPLSWLYRREGRCLLEFEREAAIRADRSFFVTDAEASLFRRLAPASAARTQALGNGVDATDFAPDHACESPFAADTLPLVFTGAMDYWPNIDAVQWFASEVLPRLRDSRPNVRFVIVGMRPAPVVRDLAGDAVTVTGTVPDVRPYLRHAAVVVAPLRVARGIQNKILEAMAMGRPVVASEACAAPIDAVAGRDLLTASDAEGFVAALESLLAAPERAEAIGAAARLRVASRYSWDAQLATLCDCVDAATAPSATPEAARAG
jgi:sugar transferase (PEP-CTERM/EpsH1 system associated)